MSTFCNYTVCFNGHPPTTMYASSLKQAVETAIHNINWYCCQFTNTTPVTVHDLDVVWEDSPSNL